MENTASAGTAAVVNVASWNRLFTVDRWQNYVDRMSTAARQQQQDRNREQHQHARGQQALHIVACVPLSKFDEASVLVLDIGGRTAECQQCPAMIWPDEASRGHANLCCAKGRSCSCEAVFPIPPL
jgi:hypothetical protein